MLTTNEIITALRRLQRKGYGSTYVEVLLPDGKSVRVGGVRLHANVDGEQVVMVSPYEKAVEPFVAEQPSMNEISPDEEEWDDDLQGFIYTPWG